MPINITKKGKEGGTIGFTVKFYDDDQRLATPKTVVWSLTDDAGSPINGRDQVSLTPAMEMKIGLTGPDLQILAAEAGQVFANRRFIVEITYDSADFGNDCTAKEVASFAVENLTKVS